MGPLLVVKFHKFDLQHLGIPVPPWEPREVFTEKFVSHVWRQLAKSWGAG